MESKIRDRDERSSRELGICCGEGEGGRGGGGAKDLREKVSLVVVAE